MNQDIPLDSYQLQLEFEKQGKDEEKQIYEKSQLYDKSRHDKELFVNQEPEGIQPNGIDTELNIGLGTELNIGLGTESVGLGILNDDTKDDITKEEDAKEQEEKLDDIVNDIVRKSLVEAAGTPDGLYSATSSSESEVVDADGKTQEPINPSSPTATNDGRRASIENRLSSVVKAKSFSKGKSTNTQSLPYHTPPSPIHSEYEIDRSIIPLLEKELIPAETKLVYGTSFDATKLRNEVIAQPDPLPGSSPKDLPSASSGNSSWLSKPSPISLDPKYQIVFSNGDLLELPSVKRNADFKELFPTLDADERLVEDYTCAWLTDMILHGRMYITQNHVCFHTKVIWTYTAIIPFAEITSVEKKAAAGLFDNCMEIITPTKKYFFTSFLSRNHAYDIIQKILAGYPENDVELVSPKRTSSKSSIAITDGRRARSLGSIDAPSRVSLSLEQGKSVIVGDEASRKGMGLAEIVSPVSSTNVTPFSESAASPTREKESPLPSSTLTKNSKHIVHQKHKVVAPTPAEIASVPTKVPAHSLNSSPTRDSVTSKAKVPSPVVEEPPFTCACSTLHKNQIKSLDDIVDLSVSETWEYLYSFESLCMAFCHKFWTGLAYTDIKGTDWLPETANLDEHFNHFNPKRTDIPCSFDNLKAGMKRKIIYIRPIANPVGASTIACFITEKIVAKSKNHVCIDSSTSTPDAPSGDCFLVNVRFCINYQEPTKSKIICSMSIQYLKSTWLKMILDQSIPGPFKDYQKSLLKGLNQSIKNGGLKKIISEKVPEVNETSVKSNSTANLHSTSIPERQIDIGDINRAILSSRVGTFVVFLFILLMVVNLAAVSVLLSRLSKLEVVTRSGEL